MPINLTKGRAILMFNKAYLMSLSRRPPPLCHFLLRPTPHPPPPTNPPFSSISSYFTNFSYTPTY